MAFWDRLGTGGDIDDRRGGGILAIGGGLTGIVLTAAFMFLSGSSGTQVLDTILTQVTSQDYTNQSQFEDPENYEQFASAVLGSTTDYWTEQFASQGKTYSPPNFVLFRDLTSSACGVASAEVGPHYCPADQTIYLDETFFDAIGQQLGANTGDVAQAYVIAHEVGHHVQNLDRTLTSQNDSVKLELQADCYAGSWSHSIAGIFENENEVSEALNLASAIGDDRIQQKTDGQVNPETWTHGSSEQRVGWFRTGFESGSPSVCTP